jgi:hypothetical protein
MLAGSATDLPILYSCALCFGRADADEHDRKDQMEQGQSKAEAVDLASASQGE